MRYVGSCLCPPFDACNLFAEWILTLFLKDSCCEMTDCQKLKDKEAQKLTKDGNALEQSSCPPCPPKICYGKINQCPLHTGKSVFASTNLFPGLCVGFVLKKSVSLFLNTAPYICTEGTSIGGCASSPWDLSKGQCKECCEIKLEC